MSPQCSNIWDVPYTEVQVLHCDFTNPYVYFLPDLHITTQSRIWITSLEFLSGTGHIRVQFITHTHTLAWHKAHEGHPVTVQGSMKDSVGYFFKNLFEDRTVQKVGTCSFTSGHTAMYLSEVHYTPLEFKEPCAITRAPLAHWMSSCAEVLDSNVSFREQIREL